MADSPLLAVPLAVAATGTEASVAAHYGNPLAEQRRLVAGEALVDLSHRAVVTVTGSDRLSWLHSMTSQSLTDLRPGVGAETLFLGPQGRVEHAVSVLDDGETTWLTIDRDHVESLVAWLTSMTFLLDVVVADRSEEYALIGSMGARVDDVVERGGVELVWHDPWPGVTEGGFGYAASPDEPWSWSEALVDREALTGLAQRAKQGDAAMAGLLAVEALRIAAGRPRLDREVDETTVPHELDWLRTAVHTSKGCYRGQETVAKLHNLGRPPRRLTMLHLDGSQSALPEPGDPLWVAGDAERTAVGRVTSAATHWELGPIALAVVKRRTDPEATLECEAHGVLVAAAQQTIVPVDAGATNPAPRLPRLGLARSSRREGTRGQVD